MEAMREQHQAPAAGMQQEHYQQGCYTSRAPVELADANSSYEATAVGDFWSQPVEEEYIDVREAVEADASPFGNDGSDAVAYVSESSGDEATAEGEAEMMEEICAEVSMDSSESCGSTLPVASHHSLSMDAASDLLDAGGHCSAAHSTLSASIGEGLTLRIALEVVLEGARDAICCTAVGACGVYEEVFVANTQRHVNHALLLAALGSCDDACRIYVLPSTTPQEQADAGNNSSPNASDSSTGIDSSRCRKGATRRHRMEATATLREGQETISATAFSFDNKLLACGCFDGIVRVYRPRVTAASEGANAPSAAPSQRPAECHRSSTQLERVFGATKAELEMDIPSAQHAGESKFERVATEATDSFADKRGNSDIVESIGVSVDLAEELRGCTADVVDLSFHPRGYALLVASADQTAWVWLLPPSIVKDSGPKAPQSRGPVALAVFAAAAPLTCCCFSSSGREGMVGAADGTVSVFSAKNGALLYAVKHPGVTPSMRQRHQEQQGEPCSVVTLRLSSSCTALPSVTRRTAGGGHSDDHPAGGYGSRSVSADAGQYFSGSERVSEAQAGTNEKEQHEDVLLGVGYEDGWIALIRAGGGDVVLARQGHEDKAVESVSFIKLTAGHRDISGQRAAEKYGCCYLFASGGLDGSVVIWDVAHKCVRASIVAANNAPGPAVASHIDNVAVQQQRTAAPGVTRLLMLQGFHLNYCPVHSEIRRSEPRHEDEWLRQQRHIQQFQAHQHLLRGAALICAGCTDGRIFVLDIRTGQVLLQWQAHVGAVMDLAVLPVADDEAVAERRPTGEPVAQPAAIGGVARAGRPKQQQGTFKCSCCWRILSAGDDGVGKVWTVSFSR